MKNFKIIMLMFLFVRLSNGAQDMVMLNGYPGEIQYKNKQSTGEGSSENSINPDEYMIGGGDVLKISALGISAIDFYITVDQNNNTYIPDFGILSLGHSNLTQSKEKISSYIGSKLKTKSQLYVVLSKSKKVLVSIAGAVSNPGSYSFDGGYRVFDAIKAANGDKMPPLNDNNYREIVYITRDTVKQLDLFPFLLNGDGSTNPYVYPGDRIIIKKSSRKVYIEGAIKSIEPGLIPIKKDETAGGLLSLITLDESADSNRIEISRTENGNYKSFVFKWDNLKTFQLSDFDLIVVPKKLNYSKMATIYVNGEISSPGNYPINDKITTIKEVLLEAGGITSLALEDKVLVIRRNAIPNTKNFSTINGSIRPEVNSAMKKMEITNDYSVISVDKNSYDNVLEIGDQVYVPPKQFFVYVSGAVSHPGAYPYKKGEKYQGYIKKAGGFTKYSDKTNTFVIAKVQDVVQQKDLNNIEGGDIIVVPDSQQDRTFTNIVMPVVSILSTTIGSIIGIIGIVIAMNGTSKK